MPTFNSFIQWTQKLSKALFPFSVQALPNDEEKSKYCIKLCRDQNWHKVKDFLSSHAFTSMSELSKAKVVNTALHKACFESHEPMVRYLLGSRRINAHINVMTPVEGSLTPLDTAAGFALGDSHSNLKVIKLLCRFAIDKDLPHRQEWIENSFAAACQRANLKAMQYFLTHEDMADIQLNPLGQPLKSALYRKQERTIDYLLRFIPTPAPYGPYDIDLNDGLTQKINHVIRSNDCTGVQYILLSANLHEFREMAREVVNQFFLQACAAGSLDVVKHMLTSSELKAHYGLVLDVNMVQRETYGFTWPSKKDDLPLHHYTSSPDTFSHTPLSIACLEGRLEVVRHLVENVPEVDIHALEDKAFKMALKHERQDIVHYFIFERNLPLTQEIESFMVDYPQAKSLFASRDLHVHLKGSLAINENHSKHKRKVKI